MKKVVLENFAKFTRKQVWFMKFPKTPFLQNTSGPLLLLLAFQKQPPEVFYEKRCSMKKGVLENFRKFKGKHLWFVKFQKHLFYRTPLYDCVWLFRSTLLKCSTANSRYSLSRNTNLRSTVSFFFFRHSKLSVYVFIGLHCLLQVAAIRVEVFCKKCVLNDFTNFIGKHQC